MTLFTLTYLALWSLVIVLALAVLALYQHFGEMYLNSRDGRHAQGPDVGASLRSRSVASLDGSRVALPTLGMPSLLLFMSTHCKVCGRLRGAVSAFSLSNPEITVVIICAGRRAQVQDWARPLDQAVRVVPDDRFQLAASYRVGVTPFLVTVDAQGKVVGRGIVNDRDGLEVAADELLVRASDRFERDDITRMAFGTERHHHE
jgi:hypothetical protein